MLLCRDAKVSLAISDGKCDGRIGGDADQHVLNLLYSEMTLDLVAIFFFPAVIAATEVTIEGTSSSMGTILFSYFFSVASQLIPEVCLCLMLLSLQPKEGCESAATSEIFVRFYRPWLALSLLFFACVAIVLAIPSSTAYILEER